MGHQAVSRSDCVGDSSAAGSRNLYIYISQPYIFNPVTLWAPNMTPVQAVLQQQDTPTSSNYAFISLSKQSGQTKILSDIE